MNLTFDPESLWYLGSIPLIVAIVQFLFKPWVPDTRLYPAISIGCGIVINLFIGWLIGVFWGLSILAGILAGLAASGSYSAISTLSEGEMAIKTNRKREPEP